MRKSTRIALGLGGAAAALLLSGCGKQVDLAASGAQPVPGVSNLWYFCHGSEAIYFSNWDGGSDEYEFIVYGSGFCVAPEQQGPTAQPSDRTENLPDDEG